MEPTTTNEGAEVDLTAVDPPFKIDSVERAEWLLRKLATIQAERARIVAQAAQMVKELDTDAANLDRLFMDQLKEFVREELARRGGRRKTLTLLQGSCSFRFVPGGIKLTDPAVALAHAQSQTGGYTNLIDLVPRLRLDQYRTLAEEALEKHGELLPGVECIPDREAFSVRFKGE